ncbi:transcriptional activator HAP3 [Candidozyma duobushaemuli]|uniref:Transcription factor CBF/NF-Y/archaeal histone domain-containing protein n=2 Tax=Candidozyma TaxID=3303203 RepID=A0ABX8IC73_9ASCO|nr:transcriptional activator HAP3 [[Candida] duobushaemulonis]PVH16346.1 transcriptional activator HAP3 [[Candida] duobushaemulonis]QWU88993.1 hypothetical protein CA3LBN_003316 [[Candida] haemuloni]
MSYSVTKEEAEAAAANSPDIELREQDRWLPIANVARLMKYTLPATAKVSKDAKECMQECVSEFISFITSEASDKCVRDKRKTINGEDILYSMHDLGFENYAEVLKIYLAKYREQQALKQERGETKVSKKQAKKREASLQEDEAALKADQASNGSEQDQNDQHDVKDEDSNLPPIGYDQQDKGSNSPDYFDQYAADENGQPEDNEMGLKHDLEVDVNLDQSQGIDMEHARYGFMDGQNEGLHDESKENGKSHGRTDGEDLGKLAGHEELDLSMADRDYY